MSDRNTECTVCFWPDPDEIATQVAENCCSGKDKHGNPKAPQRYAIIWQAARKGAIAAMAARSAEKNGARP